MKPTPVEKPHLIISRENHVEIHYADRVDFVSLNGTKLGSSKVHRYIG
jgi:hypothetical protein